MKTLKVILKALAIILSLGVVAVFFFDFVLVAFSGIAKGIGLTGIDLAFGGNIGVSLEGVSATSAALGISGYYLTTFILSVFSAALAVYGLKKNGSTVAGMIFSVITGILLLWLASSIPANVDINGLEEVGTVSGVSALSFGWVAMGLSFASAVVAALAILAGDKAKADETGAKTIPQKTVRFTKDYFGEIKKITWPKFSASVKNTVIVIVISLLIGAVVWLLDWGLSALVNLGLGI